MSLSREGSWWNPSFVRVWVHIQSSSLVFQTTQCSVSRRVSIELCLPWSSMESHDYIVFGARVPHQYSWSLETEGKKTGVDTDGSPCTLSSPYYDVPTWFSTKRGLNSAHVPENDGKMTKNSCNWICNLLCRGWSLPSSNPTNTHSAVASAWRIRPVTINVSARKWEGWEDSKFAKIVQDYAVTDKWQRKYYWL